MALDQAQLRTVMYMCEVGLVYVCKSLLKHWQFTVISECVFLDQNVCDLSSHVGHLHHISVSYSCSLSGLPPTLLTFNIFILYIIIMMLFRVIAQVKQSELYTRGKQYKLVELRDLKSGKTDQS